MGVGVGWEWCGRGGGGCGGWEGGEERMEGVWLAGWEEDEGRDGGGGEEG